MDTPMNHDEDDPLIGQALQALADAGLGNESPAEAYVAGWLDAWRKAIDLVMRIEASIDRMPPTEQEVDAAAQAAYRAFYGPDAPAASQQESADWRRIAYATLAAVSNPQEAVA